MTAFFPEGSTPRPTDSQERSLQKINSVLWQSYGGGNAATPAEAPRDTLLSTDVVIPNASTDSPAVNMRGFALVAVVTPGTLDATTFRIQHRISEGTWKDVYDGGTLDTIPCGVDRHIALNPGVYAGLADEICIVLGTVTSAARTLTLIARKLG